jgi:hypothetical protein
MERARIELKTDYLCRNFPNSAASSTGSKVSFVLDMIKDEHAVFETQNTSPNERDFEQATRTNSTSRANVVDILKGMLIRSQCCQ